MAHYDNDRINPTTTTDLLCLQSGHNDLSKRLEEFVDVKYKYKIDVVSIQVSTHIFTIQ